MLSVQWQTASTSDYERDILSTTLAPMTLWHLPFAHARTCAGGPSDGAATLKDYWWAGCAGGALGPCSWSALFHGALKTKEVSTSMSHISPTPIGKYHLYPTWCLSGIEDWTGFPVCKHKAVSGCNNELWTGAACAATLEIIAGATSCHQGVHALQLCNRYLESMEFYFPFGLLWRFAPSLFHFFDLIPPTLAWPRL